MPDVFTLAGLLSLLGAYALDKEKDDIPTQGDRGLTDADLWERIRTDGDVLAGMPFDGAVQLDPRRIDALIQQRLLHEFYAALGMTDEVLDRNDGRMKSFMKDAYLTQLYQIREQSGGQVLASGLADAMRVNLGHARDLMQKALWPMADRGQRQQAVQIQQAFIDNALDIHRAFREAGAIAARASDVATDHPSRQAWAQIESLLDSIWDLIGQRLVALDAMPAGIEGGEEFGGLSSMARPNQPGYRQRDGGALRDAYGFDRPESAAASAIHSAMPGRPTRRRDEVGRHIIEVHESSLPGSGRITPKLEHDVGMKAGTIASSFGVNAYTVRPGMGRKLVVVVTDKPLGSALGVRGPSWHGHPAKHWNVGRFGYLQDRYAPWGMGSWGTGASWEQFAQSGTRFIDGGAHQRWRDAGGRFYGGSYGEAPLVPLSSAALAPVSTSVPSADAAYTFVTVGDDGRWRITELLSKEALIQIGRDLDLGLRHWWQRMVGHARVFLLADLYGSGRHALFLVMGQGPSAWLDMAWAHSMATVQSDQLAAFEPVMASITRQATPGFVVLPGANIERG